MSELYLDIKRSFVPLLETLSSEAVVVFLVLQDRAKGQADIKVGLSLNELARRSNLSATTAAKSLQELISLDIISYEEKTKHDVITLSELYISEPLNSIPFTKKNTDETKIQTSERAMSDMQKRLAIKRSKESTLIASVLQGEERAAVGQIEYGLGRAMSEEEAYFLGKLVSAFGPERVLSTWKSSAHRAKSPLRALSAMLWNGAKGSAAKQRDTVAKEEITFL